MSFYQPTHANVMFLSREVHGSTDSSIETESGSITEKCLRQKGSNNRFCTLCDYNLQIIRNIISQFDYEKFYGLEFIDFTSCT